MPSWVGSFIRSRGVGDTKGAMMLTGCGHGQTAYGEAASIILDLAQKPMPKLCALVAYYPDTLPNPTTGFPPSVDVCVHVAGAQPTALKYKSYIYPQAEPGFAEADLDEYDKVSAGLAWTRTLGTVKKGFEMEIDIENVWEEHIARRVPICPNAQILLLLTD